VPGKRLACLPRGFLNPAERSLQYGSFAGIIRAEFVGRVPAQARDLVERDAGEVYRQRAILVREFAHVTPASVLAIGRPTTVMQARPVPQPDDEYFPDSNPG
jgi:hypothetical protein